MMTAFVRDKAEPGDIINRNGKTYRVVKVLAYHGTGIASRGCVVQIEPVEDRPKTGLRLVKR